MRHLLASGQSITVHEGSARGWLHVSDAVRAIEAAANTTDYSVINIGHPNVIPISEMAELIRKELNAPHKLINFEKLPGRMTLIKHPTLNRQKDILGVSPEVSLKDGVKMVCEKITKQT